LGIASAMAAYRLRKEEEGSELLKDVPEDLIDAAVDGAIKGMTSSNKPSLRPCRGFQFMPQLM
jgi:hypothetical protein